MPLPSGVAAIFLVGALAADPSVEAIRQLEMRALGAAQRASIPDAQALLRQIPAATEKNAEWRQCMFDRFDGKVDLEAGLPPFTAAVLRDYRLYWEAAFVDAESRDTQEAQLLARLQSLTGAPYPTLDDLEPLVAQRMANEGYHGLFGRTLPLLEFMAWKTVDETHYEVPLPSGNEPIAVFFLDDFASRGWTHYATCGRSASGGWTKPEGVYSIRGWQEDIDSENFKVSLLGHEAQHHYDLRYADVVEQWELEYRAKLAELYLSETTLADLIDRFANGRSDSKESPHGYGNGIVIGGLLMKTGARSAETLKQRPVPEIKTAARALLRESTERLDRALAAKTS